MSVEVHPANGQRLGDAAAVVGSQACWCLYYRLSAGEYGRTPSAEREDIMRRRLHETPAPGVIAYLDGQPVGWCGIGPRTEMARLARSRTIPAVDDRPVWSVVCFLVRPGFRRRGLARELLGGAVAYAREESCAGLEAYPVDPQGARIDTTFAYVGTTGMFEAAGFRRVLQTQSRSAGLPRWLMRLDLPG